MQNTLEVMKVMNYTDRMLKIPSYSLINSALSTMEGVERVTSPDETLEQYESKMRENARLNRDLSEMLVRQRAALSAFAKVSEIAAIAPPWGRIQDAIQESMHPVAHWASLRCPSSLASAAVRIFYMGGGEAAAWPPLARASDEANGELANPYIRSEVGKFAALEKEVQELKQQVAVLTGLVQLRMEPTSDPLATAKSRGSSYMKTEFERPENLTLTAASEYSGRSDRVLNLERRNGTLYALILEGNTRGYRYPKWQFDVSAARLRPVLDILASGSMSCWALHSFLTRAHSDLEGLSPSTALGDGSFPLERVLEVARRRIDPHQGAS